MIEEYQAVIDNNSWKLVDCPQNVKPIGCKWVYIVKYNQKGELENYKARLVAKGFAQQEDIDYEEIFAPIAKWNTIQLTLALAAQKGWKVHQMDVKSTFLNGDLGEEVYTTQPPDADFAGSVDDRASTLGYLMSTGSATMSWSCKKQATVATSSAEAEYISAWEEACEIVWWHKILQDLGISQVEATSLFIDSQSTIKLAKNPVFHSKTKHVDTKYHHIKSLIAKDVLKPIYCPSEDQISDIFTKPLGRIKFTKSRDELGICCNVSLDHRGEC
eukprot:PITA_05356